MNTRTNRTASRLDRIATGAIFAATLLIVSATLATAPAFTGLAAATTVAAPEAVSAHVSETGECPGMPAAAAAARRS